MGTVDTTVMSLARSHGPRSMPDLTRDRGAGTRQAPYRQASHISSQLASKATDRPAITRSPGLIGLSCRNIRASASTKAAALRWLTATPFGVPVEPEVKITHASSVRSGSSSGAGTAASSVERMTRSAVTTAATPASLNTRRARSSGSSWSTGTYAAPVSRMPTMAT